MNDRFMYYKGERYINCKGCFFADQEYCPYLCFLPSYSNDKSKSQEGKVHE